MAGFVVNIEEETLKNEYFRKVIFTAPNRQLALRMLKPGEDIGMEVHQLDQFIRLEEGDGKETKIGADWAFVIPAGTRHNVINTSRTKSVKPYPMYSPANHPPKTIHKTRADAMAAEAAHHD